jgi:hypothetical protein
MYFFLNKIENKDVKNEYYGMIDSIESIDGESSEIVFDSVEHENFEKIKQFNFWEVGDEIIPHIFIIKFANEYMKNVLKESRLKQLEGKWFRIKTTYAKTELEAQITIENQEYPEPQKIYILSIEYISKSDSFRNSLSNFFSYNTYYQSNKVGIEKHLAEINPKKEKYNYNVYNVGQGSLTALTDEKNTPIFYFDLGGAYWVFPLSYPIPLRLYNKLSKTVIISHWDLDHVETARRLFYSNPNALNGFTWIAPKQSLSPFYGKLAARMAKKGRLIFWSGAGNKKIDFWGGSLLKCSGKSKNDSGIAILLNCIKGNDSILNPGDSKFNFIPERHRFNLTGLVATHHGAKFDFENTPNCISGGFIAYSHDNRYGHPTQEAINAYEKESWVNRKDTTDGSISFSFLNAPILSGCTNLNCDLSISQHFS